MTKKRFYKYPRSFLLLRSADHTGVSGTGCILEGTVFSDGTVAVRWVTHTRSTGVYDSLEDFERIHVTPHNEALGEPANTIVWGDAEMP